MQRLEGLLRAGLVSWALWRTPEILGATKDNDPIAKWLWTVNGLLLVGLPVLSALSRSYQRLGVFSGITWGLYVTLLGTAALFGTLVAFGAQLLSSRLETSLLVSLLVSLLLFYPAGTLLQGSPRSWARSLSLHSTLKNLTPMESRVRMLFYATLTGAWLMAIVLPLDRQFEWLKWPVPLVIGAYAGNMLAILWTDLFAV